MTRDLGIYIHIPFCVSKCIYCDFYSFPADDSTKEAYVQALCRQIRAWAQAMSGDYRVVSVFFGGGTPSVLDGGLLMTVLKTVRECFDLSDDCEITIECNPGTVSDAKLKLYKVYGVNRLSFGLQSVNDDELRALGRIHTFRDFIDSYETARRCGFDNINVDVMSALPGQTYDSWKKTLRTVSNLRTEHISVYSLIVEEGTPLADMVVKGVSAPLPNEDEERRIYYLTGEILERAGYDHYEISNYAREGYECRHNILYWQRGDYIGFGAGAASFVKGRRYSDAKDVTAYILNPEDALGEPEILTQAEAMAEFMYLGMRMMRGVSRGDFRLQFGRQLDNVYGGVINKYSSSGHIIDDGENIRLSQAGIDVSNYIFADFILEDNYQ